MDEQEIALYFFRKLVYVLYLEAGALQSHIHPELAQKANLKTAFFEREKERQAAELYRLTENENNPDKVVAPYVERTGLDLGDLERLFREGDWRNKFGGYTFGGPRWVRIAEAAVELKTLIYEADWESTSELVYEIKKMKTNRGLVIQRFERTERKEK